MKINRTNYSNFAQKRLIYEDGGGNKASISENLNQTRDDNLTRVSETVKESYKDRLSMKRDLDDLVKPIETEKKTHDQFVHQLQEKLKTKLASEPAFKGNLTESYEAMGQTITVEMDHEGSYQEYVDSKPIDFQSWAIKAKQNQTNK